MKMGPAGTVSHEAALKELQQDCGGRPHRDGLEARWPLDSSLSGSVLLMFTHTWQHTATQLPNPCPGTGLDWLGVTSRQGQSKIRYGMVSLGDSHKEAALGTASQQSTSPPGPKGRAVRSQFWIDTHAFYWCFMELEHSYQHH